MPEGGYSCNSDYDAFQAFEVFEHLSFLLLQPPRWRLNARKLPPPQSPLLKLLLCVLRDLQALGFTSRRDNAWHLKRRKRWRLLLQCESVCAACPHATKCPLGALFKHKGWELPSKQFIDEFWGERDE